MISTMPMKQVCFIVMLVGSDAALSSSEKAMDCKTVLCYPNMTGTDE
jgi:hypothetical protein